MEEMEGRILSGAPQVAPEYVQLTVEEIKKAEEFAASIKLEDTASILQYGAAAQKKIADFTEKALESVKTKDMGEIGDMLASLVTGLKSFDVDEAEPKGFFGRLFRKSEDKVDKLKVQYEKAEVNINQISETLKNHQIVLIKDCAVLDQMYDLNNTYFHELTMYIVAGKKRLEKAKEELQLMLDEASKNGSQESAQEASDYSAKIERFDKKIHDLELTRMVSLQMAPQIRMLQNNDTVMSEKIQSVVANTIPLWKSQMLLALGMEHSGQAAKASRQVSDMTNELLRKNAERLKMATTETMREAERGIVDLESLRSANGMLMETIDEVVRIQTEGRQKRKAAEAELSAMEEQVRKKLIEVSRKPAVL